MSRIVGWFKVAGIVAGSVLAVGAVLAGPIALVGSWMTRDVVASVDRLRMQSVVSDSTMRRELTRLTVAAQSNRALIVMLADMNAYEVNDPRRRVLLGAIRRKDRETVRAIEP